MIGYQRVHFDGIEKHEPKIFYNMSDFWDSILADAKDVQETVFARNEPMKPLTYEQTVSFANATHCGICEKRFQPSDIRCHDHCHQSGKLINLIV